MTVPSPLPMDVAGVTVAVVGPEVAGAVVAIIHAAFGERPVLDPPSTALTESEASVADALARHGGLLARRDGRPVGALLLGVAEESLLLRRVSVVPEAQGTGVATALADAAAEVARARGLRRVHLTARTELPGTIGFWAGLGYREVGRAGALLTLAKELAVECEVATADQMRTLGQRVAGLLRAGDLIICTGHLGAGKTTFTQGIGAGLGVRGDVTSPTFVISRVHPSRHGSPPLVHADAYRLGGLAELDDLDLDVSLEDSVTVVEWGEGLAEPLAEDRLEVTITRSRGASADGERRTVRLDPVGARWVGSDLAAAVT
ncbi:MAG: tRNA threonylcarbamoyladenosine biosynthesis protein TsaE [uncultured Nocardioidaceae bacterium]|uniref:tRNA threonylcarbamoyladenosine biosynthesis protein TsaE n=1 Tax=uncultured Nocardioidaceae bacterium TaxID=253824 RepID=A0A6J4MCX5_9ACTN|nr:MAG: tRNA threonylcarbamoyladenosine biosynthesis protein TsaE [uncultured Nocardioidaceae bacterium]